MSYKPGSVIGDYVVIGAVGTGGMGAVYKVQHMITERIEAMKLLASGRTDPEQEQRFVREMQVQARLHHPNIASVYNAFRFYDEFFLVMEFIDGESLENVLQRGRMPLPKGLDYARQALFALGYAHAHGIVHRDIAPSNMLITPDGTVKLTDFGLAKTPTDVRLTHSGAPVGSPWYMSPEQVRGDATLDARSDIYSLGVVLYEIATGSKPFDVASTFDVMRAQVEMAPPQPINRAPDLPPGLNQVILTALAKDPNARFQSAEQFCSALEALQTAGVPVPQPTAVRTSPPVSAKTAAPLRPPAKRPNPHMRLARFVPGFIPKRVAQTGIATLVCGGVLFGSYATYSFLRVTSAAEVPAIPPVKASISQPDPVVTAPVQAPLSEPAPIVEPPGEPVVAPAPAPAPRTHKLTARVVAPPASAPPARSVFPPLDEVTPHSDAPPPSAATPLLATPPIPPAPTAQMPPDPLTERPPVPSPSETPTDETPKKGNRFLRALHKVFHKSEDADPPASTVTGPGPDNQ